MHIPSSDVPYGENVLDKHHLGISYSAFGHEFSVNELTVYITVPLNRNTQKTRLGIDGLTKTLLPEVCRNLKSTSISAGTVYQLILCFQ